MGGGIGVICGVGAGGRRGVWRYYRWGKSNGGRGDRLGMG